MRGLLLAANLMALTLAGEAAAQNAALELPPISIDPAKPGGTAPGAGPGSGNNVQSGTPKEDPNRSYNNLNQRLKGEVDRVNPSSIAPPLDARSQDVKVGVVNIPAVKQQYGQNFGVSVRPYRPPTPVYTLPVVPHR